MPEEGEGLSAACNPERSGVRAGLVQTRRDGSLWGVTSVKARLLTILLALLSLALLGADITWEY